MPRAHWDKFRGVQSVSFAKKLRGTAHEEDDEAMGAGVRLAWDDVTGVALDLVVIGCARLIETEFLHKKGVYTKISRTEAIRNDIRFLRNVGGQTRATPSTPITGVVSSPCSQQDWWPL